MVSYLNLFYKFYQTCETSQCIDLSRCKEQYLFPSEHAIASKISAAAKDLEQIEKTLVTHFNEKLYTINDAPRWVIRAKSRGMSFIQDAPMGPLSSRTLRVVMNHRLKRITQEKKLNVIIPNEYLVYVQNPRRRNDAPVNYEDFCVVSENLDILNPKEAVEALKSLEPKKQREIAETICRLIYHSGFMDVHMSNIALTRDHRLAIVDTEGHSLFHDITEYTYAPIALSDARIVGLKELISRSKEWGYELPDIFAQTAKKYLCYARVMKVVKIATIILSVICPLIPLLVLICSVASAKLQNRCLSPAANTHHFLPRPVTV